jgi:hypothetical protein
MPWSTVSWDDAEAKRVGLRDGRLAPPDLRFGARAADAEGKGDLRVLGKCRF